MMRARLSGGVLRSALVAVLLAVVVPAAAAMAPAPDRSTAKFEQRFLSETIDHHVLGVQMAELCLEKGTDPLLRETCERTGAKQAGQIPLMQEWLRDWYGRDEDANLPPNGDAILRRLARQPVGEEFGVEMAEEFIKHHRMQIKSSSKCVVRADDEELRELCRTQIRNQTMDIEDFETVIERYEDDSERGNPTGRSKAEH